MGDELELLSDAETQLRAEVDRWLKLRKQPTRKRTNSRRKPSRHEMPGWIADKQKRLAKIRDARQALEAERGRGELNAQRRRNARPRTASARGRFLARPQKSPIPRRSAPLPDPDSRVLDQGRLHPGLHHAAAVDGTMQIIVAHGLTQSASDCPQLVPLVDAVRANLRRKPREISADAGYCSEANLWRSRPGRSAPVATGRAKHPAETTRKVAAR